MSARSCAVSVCCALAVPAISRSAPRIINAPFFMTLFPVRLKPDTTTLSSPPGSSRTLRPLFRFRARRRSDEGPRLETPPVRRFRVDILVMAAKEYGAGLTHLADVHGHQVLLAD